MATLIPAIGSCVSRMTGGERRLAERLEAKLDDHGNSLLKPMSCGREGQSTFNIQPTAPRDEAVAIADHLGQAHKVGFASGDIAVHCASARFQRNQPFVVCKKSGDFSPPSTPSKL